MTTAELLDIINKFNDVTIENIKDTYDSIKKTNQKKENDPIIKDYGRQIETLYAKISILEKENKDLNSKIDELLPLVSNLDSLVTVLKKSNNLKDERLQELERNDDENLKNVIDELKAIIDEYDFEKIID